MHLSCMRCKNSFDRTITDVHRGRTKYCSFVCATLAKKERSAKRVATIHRNGRKQCQFCKKTKPLNSFSSSAQYKDGYGVYCKPCKSETSKVSYRKQMTVRRIQFLEQRKDTHLKRAYGISLREYKKMLSKSNGLCAICLKKSERLNLDHCHKTNKLRGLLCSKCNRGLGLFDDDSQRLLRAKMYLQL